MKLIKLAFIFSIAILLILVFQSNSKATSSLDISKKSSIVAQLIWNNELYDMPPEEMSIGIPSFIEGMQGAAKHPTADFETYFGNMPCGRDYHALHEQLKTSTANFPYETYHQQLKNFAFFKGFQIWAHFKDDEEAVIEEVILAINSFYNQNRSPKIHALSRNDIDELHESIYKKKWKREVQMTENYFHELSSQPEIEIIKENRLYLKRLNSSSGNKLEGNLAKINYRIENLYGHILYESNEPELVELDRTMPGLREGLKEMSIGEQGILFIHPEWVDFDFFAPPFISSSIIMTVEVINES